MARYIDVDDAIKIGLDMCVKAVGHGLSPIVAMDIVDAFEAIPTADVAEVVRCKDCDIPHNKWTGCPKLNGTVTDPEFYCAAGVRRKEDAYAEEKL